MNISAKRIRRPTYWSTPLTENDSWGQPYGDVMYDGKVRAHNGYWANFSQASWEKYGCGILGIGWGQKYIKQSDGKWLLVEGNF